MLSGLNFLTQTNGYVVDPYSGYGMLYDPTIILVIIGIAISMMASFMVNSTFSKYERVRSRGGMTGAMVAERILANAGIRDVKVIRIQGRLTDNYNPGTKVLSLSDSVFASSSVAAIGVAAHECGHAIQHAKGYAPVKMRTALVPIAVVASQMAIPAILIGAFISAFQFLIPLGIIMFSIGLLFQLVTLPVEFDASNRAIHILADNGILSGDEISDTKKVLNAAALTYVASAVAMLLQLIRLIMIFGGRNDD